MPRHIEVSVAITVSSGYDTIAVGKVTRTITDPTKMGDEVKAAITQAERMVEKPVDNQAIEAKQQLAQIEAAPDPF